MPARSRRWVSVRRVVRWSKATHFVVLDGEEDKAIIGLPQDVLVLFLWEAAAACWRQDSTDSLRLWRQGNDRHRRRSQSPREPGALARALTIGLVDANALQLAGEVVDAGGWGQAGVVRREVVVEARNLGEVASARADCRHGGW